LVNTNLGRAGVLAVLAAAAALVPVGAARPAEGQSYVTVVDTDRRPVVGLGAEDFAMRDGAVREPVIDVERATAPLSVAVVVDGFEPGDQGAVSAALSAAARTLAAADPRHQILMPTGADGRRPFVDALVDACQTLRTAPTDRRVVLAIARRRVGDGAVAQPGALSDAILLGKIALWTIEVGPTQTTALDRLLGDSTGLGGALREIVPSTSGLSEAATRIADLLVSQYIVTYTWPDPMLSQVSISIRHDRGVVLTPVWRR
jgi:hypothetical protein